MSKLTETRTRQKKSGRDPRKHHYVPVFYQKHFANPDGLLWVYDRQQRTFKELHPLAICFEKDLYALKPEDKPRDTRVETKVLALVDALGAMGIRDFQTGKANREAEEQVAFFMAFQYNRVPTTSRDIRATYAKLIEELGRISFANVERATAVLEKYARDTGAPIAVTPESMVEAVQGKHIEIVATEVAYCFVCHPSLPSCCFRNNSSTACFVSRTSITRSCPSVKWIVTQSIPEPTASTGTLKAIRSE